eukprot:g3005.t1
MATDDVCTANIPSPDRTHHSLPDALAARPGRTVLLLDGKPIARGARFTPGAVHRITVVPGANAAKSSWFLFDTGVGTLAAAAAAAARVPERLSLPSFTLSCNGTRASFAAAAGASAELLWTAPAAASAAGAGTVALRVAEATSMGNLSVNAAVLGAPATGLAPAGAVGFACVVGKGLRPGGGAPTRQCMSMPAGTVGALTKAACESACFNAGGGGAGAASYRCLRCDHVYNRSSDDQLLRAFEDLPDDWVCPVCGAPKSAYAKQTLGDGSVVWAH